MYNEISKVTANEILVDEIRDLFDTNWNITVADICRIYCLSREEAREILIGDRD